jgi:hypothetical protein
MASGIIGTVSTEDPDKSAWVGELPSGEPDRKSLGPLVDEGHDAAETEYYEHASDPTTVTVEQAQRRYRGMYRRRLRHLGDKKYKPTDRA